MLKLKLNLKDLNILFWLLIGTLVILKLTIHFFTYDHYGLHRDAYLYYALSQHLDWGFIAIPPVTALLTWISTELFGISTFAMRVLPAVVGAGNIIITGMIIRELGGKSLATLLGGLAVLLSPAFLHSNTLLQPVSFNQFFWVLSCYFFVRLLHRQCSKDWIWIGLFFGLGFLTKYSIVFLYLSFGIALLFSGNRKLLVSSHFLLAAILFMVIIAPNLWWQYTHNFPVVGHMEELRERQLIHINIGDFLMPQLWMNVHAIGLWVGGLIVLLFVKKERNYQAIGIMYLSLILLLVISSGKAYYALGIYPVLFAFGAYYFEKYVNKWKIPVAMMLFVLMFGTLFMDFDGIPFGTPDSIRKEKAYRWEDGEMYDLPQDLADMTGWSEIGQSVVSAYYNLSEEDRSSCRVLCYHYGTAGAVMFYGGEVDVPQPICFNASFVFWMPDEITEKNIIWIHSPDSDFEPTTMLPERFEEVSLLKTIINPDFRENGTEIWLCRNPKDSWRDRMKREIANAKAEYQRQ